MEFDASLLVVMGIFWVTFFILRSFLFKPVLQLLEDREAETAAAHQAYQSALAENEEKLEAQRAEIAAARAEARTQRDEMRREVQALRQQTVSETQAAVDAKLEKARGELEEQVSAERAKLEERAGQLGQQMAAQVLRRVS